MITYLQAQAILSLLMAFGVPQITINQVHDILIPTVQVVGSIKTPLAIIETLSTVLPSCNIHTEWSTNEPTQSNSVVIGPWDYGFMTSMQDSIGLGTSHMADTLVPKGFQGGVKIKANSSTQTESVSMDDKIQVYRNKDGTCYSLL